MIDGLQFAVLTRSPLPVTSQLLFPPSSFHTAMQGYITHYSCNSETILCKIHRINRKDSNSLTKSILNFNLTTIHQLQLPQNRAIFLPQKRCFPNSYTTCFGAVLLRLSCKSFRFTFVYTLFGAPQSNLRELQKT